MVGAGADAGAVPDGTFEGSGLDGNADGSGAISSGICPMSFCTLLYGGTTSVTLSRLRVGLVFSFSLLTVEATVGGGLPITDGR